MTLISIQLDLASIRRAATEENDFEKAHQLESRLFHDFVQMVAAMDLPKPAADGWHSPGTARLIVIRDMAQAILTSKDIKFTRIFA